MAIIDRCFLMVAHQPKELSMLAHLPTQVTYQLTKSLSMTRAWTAKTSLLIIDHK